jgi:hypothetical protein
VSFRCGLSRPSRVCSQVKRLSRPLKSSSDIEQRHQEARQLRRHISEFVVRQLEETPSISQRQPETQLRKILGAEPCDKCHDCDGAPQVFTLDPGPKTTRRQLVIAYSLSAGFMGPKGNMTILESFLWEMEKARLTAHGGAELDDYSLNVQQVSRFTAPDEYSVLAWGQVLGGNGRCIGGKAIVYRVAVDSVAPAWQSSSVACNLTAQRNSVGWELDYGDKELAYGNDPHPRYFDVYSIDYPKRTFDRMLSKRY